MTMTAKPQAPVLFGKRMVWSESGGEFFAGSVAVIKADIRVYSFKAQGFLAKHERDIWRFCISSDCGMGDGSFFTHGLERASAQAAANDAARYLTRLHRALGKVVGA